ncbi:MAG: cyclic pyranopterin monophosphate synthase MoaC [Fibrobacter sp.]|nr:cyclic pyranopterin monophosphate synthase MoaC [Fibrobacter sp.]
MSEFSHIDEQGSMTMVDVSAKGKSLRTAVAKGDIIMQEETIKQLQGMLLKKGDALACARVAGIMAAKKTADLIPLCHPLLLNNVSVDFVIHPDRVGITATVACEGSTGVEMEALTAVSVAALTLYDMCKAIDKKMIISNMYLVSKKKEGIK